MLMAGGMHRLIADFCIYEGLGYGQRDVAWEQYNCTQLLNTDFSYRGISAEAGGLYRFRRMVVSAGIMTIRFRYWEAAVGVGINFYTFSTNDPTFPYIHLLIISSVAADFL